MADIDKTIQTLFDKLKTRKARVEDLKAQMSKAWLTNGAYRLIGSGTPTNIQTAPADTIAQAATDLCLVAGAKTEAAEKLGVEIDTKVSGYSAEAWFTDFKKRLATINVREEERLVAELESRLNSVLSPEERRRIEVELLLKDIG